MTDPLPFPSRSELASEAAAWAARADGGLTPEERAELDAWLARSPSHRESFREATSLFLALGDALSLPKGDTLPAREGVRLLAQRRPARLAGAAAGLVAILALPLALTLRAPPAAPPQPSYATAIGEQRTLTLPDGTEVVLNTGTQVRLAYAEGAREVHMGRGEASFDVAHDPARPFVVHAGDGVARALGTVFAVRLDAPSGLVEVTVEEGRVEVAALGDQGAQTRILTAHQQAELHRGEAVVRALGEQDTDRELSWRGGTLVFEATPLPEVVAEISRYTRTKIAIADPALQDIEIDGRFPAGEVDALLAALEQGFGVEVDRVSATVVFLR